MENINPNYLDFEQSSAEFEAKIKSLKQMDSGTTSILKKKSLTCRTSA
jgi:hypothetical protein